MSCVVSCVDDDAPPVSIDRQCHEAQQRAECGDVRGEEKFERTTSVSETRKQVTTELCRERGLCDQGGCARLIDLQLLCGYSWTMSSMHMGPIWQPRAWRCPIDYCTGEVHQFDGEERSEEDDGARAGNEFMNNGRGPVRDIGVDLAVG